MAARPRLDLLLGRHDAEVHDTELARCGTGHDRDDDVGQIHTGEEFRMTQHEQDAIAAETMAWINDIDRQLRQEAARINERNGKMSAQQYQKERKNEKR